MQHQTNQEKNLNDCIIQGKQITNVFTAVVFNQNQCDCKKKKR